MTAQLDNAPTVRTYGNWSKPRSPGLPRLGLVGTAGFFVGAVLVILMQMVVGWVAAAVMLLLVAALLAPVAYQNRAGRNGWQIALARLAWRRGKRKRRNVYLASLTAPISFGSTRLPGLLAKSEVFAAQTALGEPFALISIPSTRHYAVVLAVQPEGAQLVDTATVDTWVANHGHFIAELAHEPSLETCSVTIETAPDPGNRLAAEVERMLVEGCPPLARQMMEEAAATFPHGSASVRAWVTLTFTARQPVGHERGDVKRPTKSTPAKVAKKAKRGVVIDLTALDDKHDADELSVPSMLPQPSTQPRGVRSTAEMATQIGQRLTGLMAMLRTTGAGEVRPMAPAQLAEMVRTAYDPAAGPVIDRLRNAGQEPGITWENAGPAAQIEEFGSLRHDSGTSVTWQMVKAPTGAVQSRVLERLLAPDDHLARKRVTIIYRPYDPSKAPEIADAEVRTAIGYAGARAGESRAGDTLALQAARQAAREQASGAGLVRFSILVTATVDDPADLRAAVEAVEQAGGASRLRLRRAYASQAASFAAALGVGIVLPKHVMVPEVIRENL